MREVVNVLTAALILGAVTPPAIAQQEVNFERPIFTTQGTALCTSQSQVAALRRALDDQDRAAIDRIIGETCRLVGPNIRLSVVSTPGTYDPDVEVRVDRTPALDLAVPRGNVWTLKALLRN